MSIGSKKNLASIITGILVLNAYLIFAIGGAADYNGNDVRWWAIVMLCFIGIAVVATIIVQIAFHIGAAIAISVKEKTEDEKVIASELKEDERDKLIEQKAYHIGYIVAGLGFLTTLIALALNASPVAALHILFCSFCIGSLAEGIARIYFYEKGTR